MTLVRREVGSLGFSGKKSERALVGLVEGRPWRTEAHVALAGQLLLMVEVVAVVHQGAGALVIKHVLPRKPC